MQQIDRILGSALLGISGLSDDLLRSMRKEILNHRLLYTQPAQIAQLARERIEAFEPVLAKHLSDATLASWVTGFDSLAGKLPKWVQDEFQAENVRNGPPVEPPEFDWFGMFGEPEFKLLNVEQATDRLLERGILTREQFDAASEAVQRDSFEIAGDLKEDTIGRLRQFLVEDIHSGTSLKGFKNRIDEHLGSAPIAPGHLETVYRTNTHAALRDGRETLRANPIVRDLFPYQEYIPIRDTRARHEHIKLGELGLNGTGIYRADDPVWEYFTPPWDYNCRCGSRLLTIAQAARSGVREAQEWLKTGRPPQQPEYRIGYIPFPPNPGWGSRGRVGLIRMSAWDESDHPRDAGGQFVDRMNKAINRTDSRPHNKAKPMSYWTDRENPDIPDDHPWCILFKQALKESNERRYDELEKAGDLDAYVNVQTASSLEEFRDLLKSGMPRDVARELVMRDFLPSTEEEPEEYEIEGELADEIAGLEDFLGL